MFIHSVKKCRKMIGLIIFVIVRPTTQRGNFELDIEGDEIDDEDDDEGNLGVPASAIRPTGKNKFTSMFCLIRVDQKFCHIFSTFDNRYIYKFKKSWQLYIPSNQLPLTSRHCYILHLSKQWWYSQVGM